MVSNLHFDMPVSEVTDEKPVTGIKKRAACLFVLWFNFILFAINLQLKQSSIFLCNDFRYTEVLE